MTRNLDARDAKRFVREGHNVFKHINAKELLGVAKGFAHLYEMPQKVMLKAMARYIRLHHSK
jgi:hypothetical protein